MAMKSYLDKTVLKIVREVDLCLHNELDVVSSCSKAGV